MGGCALGRALLGAEAVAVSPDGRNVYVVDRSGDAVAVFDRDAESGTLAQPPGFAGCVSDGGQSGCAAGRALDSPGSVAVSPDGRNLYVSSIEGVAVLTRDPLTGSLAQPAGSAGCVSGNDGEGCAAARAVGGSRSIAISPDGKSLYADGGASIGVFSRDAETGTLTQPAGPDGCLAGQDRPPPDCTHVEGLAGVNALVVSADGRSVFATSAAGESRFPRSSAVFRFDRDQATGALQSPPGEGQQCVGSSSLGASCTLVRGLLAPVDLAPSQDGRRLYVAAVGFDRPSAVVVLDRDPETTALSQASGPDGCVGVAALGFPPCRAGRALEHPLGVAVSADGHAVYVATAGSDSVAVLVRPIVRVATRRASARRRRVALPVRCYAEAPGRCDGTLELRQGRGSRGRERPRFRVAGGRFAIAPGETETLTLGLTRRARRTLASRGRLRTRAVTRAEDGLGHAHTGIASVVIRAARRRR